MGIPSKVFVSDHTVPFILHLLLMALTVISTALLIAGVGAKLDPEANLQGLCNQYGVSVSLLNLEEPSGINSCTAAAHESCDAPQAGWIPWANSDEDIQSGHRMVLQPSNADLEVCLYHVTSDKGNISAGIYGSVDCQFHNGIQLGSPPGQWMVVLSPTGTVSLWAPTPEKKCPAEPQACRANATTGHWQYRYTIPGAVTETWRHGTTKTYSESKTDEWSESVSVAVDAGFKFLGVGVDTTVTTEFSHQFSQTYSNEWSTTDEHDFQVTWSEKDIGRASWQFVVNELDTCGHQEESLLREFAITPNRLSEPCCLPGYSFDAPYYTKCAKGAMLPKKGCSSQMDSIVV